MSRPAPALADALADAAARRLAKRYAAERRFQATAIGAVVVAAAALALLLVTVAGQGFSALTAHWLAVEVTLDEARIDPAATRDPADLRRANYAGLLQDALRAEYPHLSGRSDLRALYGLFSRLNGGRLLDAVLEDPGLIGRTITFSMPLDDAVDLFLEEVPALTTSIEQGEGDAPARIETDEAGARLILPGDVLRQVRAREAQRLRADAAALDADAARALLPGGEDSADDTRRREERAARLRSSGERLRAMAQDETVTLALGANAVSVLAYVEGAAYRLTDVDAKSAGVRLLVPAGEGGAASDGWRIEIIESPEANRRVSDLQYALARDLKARGLVTKQFASFLFTRADSSEPELAGVLGAFVGSLLTMMVTMLLAVPIGVGAAIYLEEFAPKNRLTSFVEVNINNLAAVPSIVFGLLGVAVLLNFFGVNMGMSQFFGRGFALVGGVVLALRTLPTVIIATRSALKAVPPSIRAGALALGASPVQAVFHHVLPLAAPGVMTGSIIGLAQALGETAPLLLIGMVAFVADVPASVIEPATVLPVQVFIWADSAERAFAQRTAAAILVLLSVMIVLNVTAVLMRRRFERRW